MKILSTAVLSVFLVGCAGVHNAEKYAGGLKAVLNSYQTEVARKVKAEQDSYTRLAPLYDTIDTSQKLRTLAQERQERASALTDEVFALHDSGARLSMSNLGTLLRDYGSMDFSMTRDLLAREMGAANQRLAALEALSSYQQQAHALDAALTDLSTPKGKLTNLKDLASYVQTAKGCLDQKRCAALQTELDGLQQQLLAATSDADKTRLTSLVTKAQAAQAENCTPPPACGTAN